MKFLAIPVSVETTAHNTIALPMYHEGRIRVINMFDGIPPRIYPENYEFGS